METNQNINNESDPALKKIAELLQESRDNSAFSETQKRELNELLRANEKNRSFAAQYLLDSESLKELLAADEISAISTGHAPKPSSSKSDSRSNFRIFPLLAYAASFAIISVLAFSWINRAPIGLIQDESGAVFTEGAGPKNDKIEKKSYSLVSGMIAVELRNGVTMTVKGPAKFEVVDEFRIRLNSGSIRAIAPESGHGFTIETPDADIEDLGTEFGVSVDGNSGDSEVHVFDGRVDVKNRGKNDAITSLEIGESAKILDGQVNAGRSGILNQFFTPADVGFARWNQSSEAIRQDKDVVFYYGFNKRPGNDRILKDEANHGASIDGTISGARWVSGRWPGKSALLFDQKGDNVAINIPGELPQFTFAAWIKLDRIDEPLTAIMNSIDWKPGSMHIQISRSLGTIKAGIYPKVHKDSIGMRMPTGRWVLVVMAVDAEKRTARTWIDNKIAIDGYLRETPSITPGLSFLGGFYSELGGEQSRDFRGRIDEVVLWRRTLDEREIRQLYKRGRPQSRAINDS